MNNQVQDNIDAITRRIQGSKADESKLPSEMIQCVVFYRSPISDNIDIDLKRTAFNKKTLDFIDQSLENQFFIFPYYSKEVFLRSEDASMFLPLFIKQLITEEKLPKEVLNEKNEVDENRVITGFANLELVLLEPASDSPKLV